MTIYIQPSNLDKILSVKKFKQHSESLQSLLSKVQSDLHKRYTPFDPHNFSKFAKDLHEGMSLISLLSEDLAFDLKYSNMQFLVEPFKRINLFSSNILNTLFVVFQGCYGEYLRIADDFAKASESWLPLQFLLKQGIRLDGMNKYNQQSTSNALNPFVQKSQEQDKRDIQQMNDSIQQKKLYLKYLAPVTQTQLSKMQQQIQKIGQLTKNIIDNTFKGMSNAEQILNKAWSQQLLKKWKQDLMLRLREIAMGLARSKKEMEDKERSRKDRMRDQEVQVIIKVMQTAEKPKKPSKKGEFEKYQKQIELKTIIIKDLEDEINKLKKRIGGPDLMRNQQQQKKREQLLIRQFAEKNQKLQYQLSDLKFQCLNKQSLVMKKLEDTQSKLTIVQHQLDQLKNGKNKQKLKIKQLQQQINKLHKERIDQIKQNDTESVHKTKKSSIYGAQEQCDSLSKIGSFNNIERSESMKLYNRMSRDLRSLRIEKNKKNRDSKESNIQSMEKSNIRHHNNLYTEESQGSQGDLMKLESRESRWRNKNGSEKEVAPLKSMKQVLQQVKLSHSKSFIKQQTKKMIQSQSQQSIQGQNPHQIFPQSLQQQQQNPIQPLDPSQSPFLSNTSSLLLKSKSLAHPSLPPVPIIQTQLQFQVPKSNQTFNKLIHRKGIMKDKGAIHKGVAHKKSTEFNTPMGGSRTGGMKPERGSIRLQKMVTIEDGGKNRMSPVNSPRRLLETLREENQTRFLGQQKTSAASFLGWRKFMTQKSVETQTMQMQPILNNIQPLKAIQQQKRSSDFQTSHTSNSLQQTLSSKRKYILPSPFQHTSSYKKSLQPSLDTLTLSTLQNKNQQNPLANTKLATIKIKSQLPQFCKLQMKEISRGGFSTGNKNRISQCTTYNNQQKSKTAFMKQNINRKKMDSSLDSTIIQKPLLLLPFKNRNSDKIISSSSKLQQTMLKFLKLLKSINQKEFDLFMKAMTRLNKYVMDDEDESDYQSHLNRKLFSYLNSNQKCDSCLILKVFVEKMEVIGELFGKEMERDGKQKMR